MTIGVVAATASGAAAARVLAAAWPDEVRRYDGGKGADDLRRAFGDCDAVVSFLAVGATVRVLAPCLGAKTTDAAVVCVDEALRFAVAVLGGHHGANELAERLSAVLGTEPVITTASDAANVQPLDGYGADLGFTVADPSALARIGARLLSRRGGHDQRRRRLAAAAAAGGRRGRRRRRGHRGQRPRGGLGGRSSTGRSRWSWASGRRGV